MMSRKFYDRHDYAEEKRAALDRLGESLGRILRHQGGKVVPLHSNERLRMAS